MLVVRKQDVPLTSVKYIALEQGNVCIVDPDLHDWLLEFPWRMIPSGNYHYVGFGKRINGKYVMIRMHRLITLCPSWIIIHHINNNRLDNRRENLQAVTKYEHRHLDGWHIFLH